MKAHAKITYEPEYTAKVICIDDRGEALEPIVIKACCAGFSAPEIARFIAVEINAGRLQP